MLAPSNRPPDKEMRIVYVGTPTFHFVGRIHESDLNGDSNYIDLYDFAIIFLEIEQKKIGWPMTTFKDLNLFDDHIYIPRQSAFIIPVPYDGKLGETYRRVRGEMVVDLYSSMPKGMPPMGRRH